MSSRRSLPDITGMVSVRVDNLAYRTTNESLKHTFEKYGEVGDVYIPRDRMSGESRGFAYVRYYDKRDADDAVAELDGTRLDGREIRVQRAKYERPEGNDQSRQSRGGRPRSRSRSRSRGRRDSPIGRSRSGSRGRNGGSDFRRRRSRSPF